MTASKRLRTIELAELMAVGLAALSALSAAFGLHHALLVAQRGVVCGSLNLAHCWRCYAAVALAMAAAVSWGFAKRLSEPVHARA